MNSYIVLTYDGRYVGILDGIPEGRRSIRLPFIMENGFVYSVDIFVGEIIHHISPTGEAYIRSAEVRRGDLEPLEWYFKRRQSQPRRSQEGRQP